ncbi:hypothetical protein Dfri01_21510 [Dyadobacter frigoris]|uniref:hypothetical protein n=1 Tax=Dyadobacter frigoris TaxID=2576211 RepID=UPI0024A2D482|nr:hypothetical protein [Dyadobacter frigoris]GLU52690.1 hypothetical protein Dfri01_21510 [Dyadobacter frigoris]
MINIVVIDEHAVFRRGIHEVLKNSLLSFDMTGFANQKEFMDVLGGPIPNLFIANFNGSLNTADMVFLKQIKKDYKANCIVIFSNETQYSRMSLCSNAGFHRFLTKMRSPEKIAECIGVVMDRKKIIYEQVYEFVINKRLSGYSF